MRYTAEELAALWIKAGGPVDVAKLAAAIAIGESHGDPDVFYENKDKVTGRLLSTDKGLWQINDKVHPEHNDNPNVWYDPLTNAKKAVAIYLGRGDFGRWNAFMNGSYKQFLDKEYDEPS